MKDEGGRLALSEAEMMIVRGKTKEERWWKVESREFMMGKVEEQKRR